VSRPPNPTAIDLLVRLARGGSVRRYAGEETAALQELGLAEPCHRSSAWLKLTEEGERLADELGVLPVPTEMRAWRVLARRPTTTAELAAALGITVRGARFIVEDMRRDRRLRRVGTRWPGRVPVWLARRAA
jgi:hypothetical protein